MTADDEKVDQRRQQLDNRQRQIMRMVPEDSIWFTGDPHWMAWENIAPYQRWLRAREKYVLSGDVNAKREMEYCVNFANPPEAGEEPAQPRSRREIWLDRTAIAVGVTLIICGLVIALGIGVLGWPW